MQHERLAKAVIDDRLPDAGTSLPCTNVMLKNSSKMVSARVESSTPTCLLPALTEFCHHKQNTLLPVTDESKLAMTVMAVDDNPANLKLIGALLEDMCNTWNFAIAGIRQLNGRTDAVRFDSNGY